MIPVGFDASVVVSACGWTAEPYEDSLHGFWRIGSEGKSARNAAVPSAANSFNSAACLRMSESARASLSRVKKLLLGGGRILFVDTKLEWMTP